MIRPKCVEGLALWHLISFPKETPFAFVCIWFGSYWPGPGWLLSILIHYLWLVPIWVRFFVSVDLDSYCPGPGV